MVGGVTIPFDELEPTQQRVPFPYDLGPDKETHVNKEIANLLVKGVVTVVQPVEGQFISNVFVRPKPNGDFRLILNLSKMNENVEYSHFKMTSLQTAVELMRPGCWMTSIDLKDAYYSVLVRQEDRKFLRFIWDGILYEFTGMPNGLACAPRIFTKILTPVFANLRELGYECFSYIDDSFILADSPEKCRETTSRLGEALDRLGFVVHTDKSVFTPTQEIVFLGFVLDSQSMTVTPTQEKVEKFQNAVEELFQVEEPTIREVAGIVGLMSSNSPGVQYGPAHIKRLEREKNAALARAKGNFDATMYIGREGLEDIQWWLDNLPTASKKIRNGGPDLEMCTDASDEGWGAHRGENSTGGRWKPLEKIPHTNVQELNAILLGLQALVPEKGVTVKVRTDNTTALAYVRKMGGVKSVQCDDMARRIWEWCAERDMWLLIAHIPGVENKLADFRSRYFSDDIEWELNPKIFQKICDRWGTPDIDLFASRTNNKLDNFVSWNPEPEALGTDAFSMSWTNWYAYIFPPFSLVGNVVQRLTLEPSKAVLVTPDWPGQPWFGTLWGSSRQRLRFRKGNHNLIQHGFPKNPESIRKIPLVVWHFS